MSEILNGLGAAARLVFTLDPYLLEIAARSLAITLSAVAIASLIGLPLGAWLAVHGFRGRRWVVIVLNGLMGLPPVVVGLFVYLTLSRNGPLGVLGLLFTPTAMIIAQVIILLPLIASIALQLMQDLWEEYAETLTSLDASPGQQIRTLLWEGRHGLVTASLAGFGRGIGEVGAIMIVGGNIDHATRVLTTAITLETSRGNFALAMGLGLVLIALALLVTAATHLITRSGQRVGT